MVPRENNCGTVVLKTSRSRALFVSLLAMWGKGKQGAQRAVAFDSPPYEPGTWRPSIADRLNDGDPEGMRNCFAAKDFQVCHAPLQDNETCGARQRSSIAVKEPSLPLDQVWTSPGVAWGAQSIHGAQCRVLYVCPKMLSGESDALVHRACNLHAYATETACRIAGTG